ncbi:tRNA pseudouridine(55) synthase [Polytolypa hystricis UAMH7299]|uniref:tRNA pseudouridine(55) synthase n=1 Tax=Polytolypa hystricis (strain UAMH7299) TaxID=1447883 RepID=A0A2B7YE14_POLH7|nr:tRNA pseudouridine(55) synthase [Polytolypa hystricis UAMH7299]
MSTARSVEGVFAVHKPGGISSAEVLRNLQTYFNPSKFFQPWIDAERAHRKEQNKYARGKNRRREKRIEVKIGHGGTLDPIATGVLIAGVGKGTKDLHGFLGCTKTYEAVVLFGAETDTYDRVGKIVNRAPYEHVTRELVETTLEKFRGKILQKPSIFSALKVDGKKMYEYAREGKVPPVEIVARPVEVFNLEILEWYEPGSHEYVWPTEEAGNEEKVVAKTLIDNDARGITEGAAKVAEMTEGSQKEGEEDQSRKRKTPPTEEDSESKPPTTTAADAEAEAEADQEPSSPPPTKRIKTDETTTTTAAATPEAILATISTPTEASPPSPSPKPPSPPAVKITMTVSSGFYVRSLAHDLGLAVHSNAIMSTLVRTRQADFDLTPERILEYKDLEAGEEVWAPKVQGFFDEWAAKKEREKEEKKKGGE